MLGEKEAKRMDRIRIIVGLFTIIGMVVSLIVIGTYVFEWVTGIDITVVEDIDQSQIDAQP